MREQLAGLAQAQPELLGAVLEDLVGPPLPPAADHAWRVFSELSQTRAIVTGGIAPIAYTELDAYCRLTADTLTALDVALVRTADREFISHALAQITPDATPSPDPPET